jgi:ABC-type dipeptide/oligopeptide/nickel transport system permease component
MSRTISKRFVGSCAAILGASVLAFVCFRTLPGDPARLVGGQYATPEAVIALRHQMGLDQPLPLQYWSYLSGFFRGDWGISYTLSEPVTQQVGERLPASLELGLVAFLLTSICVVALALAATYGRRRGFVDHGARLFAYLSLGTPPFLVGLFLLVVFSKWLNVLPGPEGELSVGVSPPRPITHMVIPDALLRGEWQTAFNASEHILLPAIALAVAPIAALFRILRANLLEVGREPFILLVRSKGVSRFATARKHALPNAFLPTLTVSGLVFGQMIGGAILVESVFHWPGIGALTVDSVLRKDFALPETFVLLAVIVYVLINLFVDLLYGFVDPRVRLPSQAR